MGSTHWTDYVMLSFVISSAACFALVGARKTIKFGQIKGSIQELDSFDKKLLKLSALLFIAFLISLAVRLLV